MAAQLRRKYLGTRQFSSRDLAVQHDEHHPCWKAAHFLPCTRPPDVLRMHRPQRHTTFGPSARRAFVTTRSGFPTMPSGGLGDDKDTDVSFGTVRCCRLFRHRSSTCNPSQVGRPADCSCVTRRQRCWHHHIRAHWFQRLRTCTTTPTLHFLKSPVFARIRFLSNARSMPFLPKKPVLPSLPLLPGSPTRTTALTLTLMLLVNVSCYVGERTRTSYPEGCSSGGLSVFLYFLCDWINFSSLPDGLRQFLFGDHNHLYVM